MADTPIVSRFAPSPTGYLHVGGARTALFSWLLARHADGTFLLRIEDTDVQRSTEEAGRQLLEDLNWLGLHWDNPELVYQSKRLPIYDAIIEDLLARGLAYKAYETDEELDATRKAAESQRRQFRYRRPKLTDEQIRQYESEGRPSVVRFAMPVKEYRFDDAVLGPGQGFGPSEVQDFVIRKSRGPNGEPEMPTYHFAVVVDDHDMGVTHVLRGQEHLLNTCNHVALQEALGYPRPIYAHLPVILSQETGEKLGKRDRDKKIRHHANLWMKKCGSNAAALATAAGLPAERISTWLPDDRKQLDVDEQTSVMRVIGLKKEDLPEILIHDFRQSGYLPEALLNFLSLLGWSPGGDRERMSMSEMIELFSLEAVGKSNAKFNREKLLAFNTEAVASASPDRLVAAFRDYLSVNPESPLNAADDATLARLLQMKKGFRLLREVDELTRFFFIPDEQIQYDAQAVDKVLLKNDRQGLGALRDTEALLQEATEWTVPALEAIVTRYGESKGLGLGKIAQPIRVAISGTTVSPPIFESLEFLGKQRTLSRIGRCIEHCK